MSHGLAYESRTGVEEVLGLSIFKNTSKMTTLLTPSLFTLLHRHIYSIRVYSVPTPHLVTGLTTTTGGMVRQRFCV